MIARLCPLTTKDVVDTRGLEKTRVMKKRTMAAAVAEYEFFIFSPWLMVMGVASKIIGQ